MSLTKQDQEYIDAMIPQRVKDEFADQNKQLANGTRKRATLPNSDNEFKPLEGLRERLNHVHDSAAMQHAVDSCARND